MGKKLINVQKTNACSCNGYRKTSLAITKAIKKFSIALPKSIDEAVNSVRVGVRNRDQYLEEIATGKQTLKYEKNETIIAPIAKYSKEQLKNSLLKYDKTKQALINHHGDIVSTSGIQSKGINDVAAFYYE